MARICTCRKLSAILHNEKEDLYEQNYQEYFLPFHTAKHSFARNKHFLRNCHKWQDYTEGDRDKPASMETHNNLAWHIRAPRGSAAPPQQGYRCLCSTTAQIWCSPVIWDQTAVKEPGEQDPRGASFEASLASLRSHSSSLRG